MRQHAEKYEEVMAEFAPLSAYERAYIDGMAAYAWWHDGRMQVGTGGTSLAQATRRFLEEHRSLKRTQAREAWNEATGEGVDMSQGGGQ